jgi:flagellar motor switch protein FliM
LAKSNANRIEPEPNLSNEEISELAEAMSKVGSGTASQTQQVRPYDFVHPEKLSKRNLRALGLVYSELTRTWTAALSAALKTAATVETRPNQQARLGNYADAIQDARLVFEFHMDPLPGSVYLDAPAALGVGLVDRMAGGSGEVKDQSRPLTQIERNIMKRLVERLMKDVSAAWEPVGKVKFTFSKHYDTMSEAGLDTQEPLLITGTSWTIGSANSEVNLLMPVRCLYPSLEDLTPDRWLESGDDPGESSLVSVENLLEPVELTMTVDLGHARISLQDALNMEAGDVIRLGAHVGDPLEASIGGKVMFYALPGLVRNKLSVQIVECVRENTSVDDTIRVESQSYAGAA